MKVRNPIDFFQIASNFFFSRTLEMSKCFIVPIYEYYCPENNTIYSFLAKSISQGSRIPRCPDNPAFTMRKQLSAFAVTGATKKGENGSAGADGDAGMEDPQVMEAMASLEQEMSGIDEDNPDPRQLGYFMRKMTDLTGQKLPDTMEEMVRRMEAGEDPEQLEDEFGDALDSLDSDEMGAELTKSAEPKGGSSAQKLFRRMRSPKKDPELYDLSDYLD